jgi:hypothetical protein
VCDKMTSLLNGIGIVHDGGVTGRHGDPGMLE